MEKKKKKNPVNFFPGSSNLTVQLQPDILHL